MECLCLATAALLAPVHVGIIDPRALLKILEPCEVELPPVEDGAPERLSVCTLITRRRHQCEVDILLVDCLMTTPLVVGPILSRKASICHVVGMGQRVCRKRLLVHMAPTKGTLKRVRESSLLQRRSKRTAPRVRGCNWRSMHDPRIAIHWLAATEHVKKHQSSLVRCACLRLDICEAQAVRCVAGDGLNTPCPLRDFAASQNSFGRRCILGVAAMVARDT